MIYSLLQSNAAPANAPGTVKLVPGKTTVACLGASIVHGRVSFDIVGALQAQLGEQFQVVNAGLNGDLAWNALSRLDSVIACRPDYVIVLVGSNDVMAAMNARAERRYRKMKKLPTRPTRRWYAENLRAIVQQLRAQTSAEIALCSLPPIGEQFDAPINLRIAAYNAVVRELAKEHGAAYLPIHEAIAAAISGSGSAQPKATEGSPWLMLSAICEHYVLGSSFDAIAHRHGFAVHTDGVHLNSYAGRLIVERFAAFVRAHAEHISHERTS
ncbi:MAG: hypothetical protein RL701_3721 [Pseudomonadota bacterium]